MNVVAVCEKEKERDGWAYLAATHSRGYGDHRGYRGRRGRRSYRGCLQVVQVFCNKNICVHAHSGLRETLSTLQQAALTCLVSIPSTLHTCLPREVKDW